MKKLHKTLMLVSVILAAAFGMASCQQDDEWFDQQATTENQKSDETTDVAFANNFNFQYGGSGVTSPDQYVKDCDFSLNKDAMKMLGKKGLSSDNVGLDILWYVGDKMAGAACGKVGGIIWDMIFKPDQDDHSKEILDQLSELQDKIDGLSRMINDLITLSHDIEVATIYRERMHDYLDLSTVNLCAYTDFFAYLSKGDTIRADSVVNKWADRTVNGSPAISATSTYMQMLAARINSMNMNMAQIYDYWVFQTTPWEHMGYQKREQLRAGDLSVAMAGFLMGEVYYSRRNAPSSDIGLKQLEESFRIFKAYYEDYGEVKHHDDKRICQIKDAHIVFGKDIIRRDMENHPWYGTGSQWHFDDENVQRLMYGDTDMEALMTPEEATTIYKFYNSGTDKKTFYGILLDAGFDFGKNLNYGPGGPMVMNLNVGCHEENGSFIDETNYDFYYDKVLMLEEPDLIRKNFLIGRMWIEWRLELIYLRYYLRRWVDGITPSQCKLFRTDISKRYAGMDPGF